MLLYGCETWTPKESLINELDGVYTRMLRRVFDIHWKSHTTNLVLYGTIPKLSETVKQRRLRFSGHIYRHDDQPFLLYLLYDLAVMVGDPDAEVIKELMSGVLLGVDELLIVPEGVGTKGGILHF